MKTAVLSSGSSLHFNPVSKSIDILIYGATGYTGRQAAKILSQRAHNLRWAIAGRNHAALTALLSEFSSQPQVRVADGNSLTDLCSIFADVKVVINCAGPYRYTGKTIVAACVQSKTDYLDITGEPQFMDDSALSFHETAAKNGILVVHACGFDSIPAELGWLNLYLRAQGQHQVLTNIESFWSAESEEARIVYNSGTYESAVMSFLHVKEIHRLRKQLSQHRGMPYLLRAGKALQVKTWPYFERRVGWWVHPFLGADSVVVRNSQQLLAAKDKNAQWPRYVAYIGYKSFFELMADFVGGLLIIPLIPFSFTRNLVLKYPSFFSFGRFSKAGPRPEKLSSIRFQMDLFGVTENGQELHFRVSGPEPGYVATPIMLLEAALCVLQSRSRLPTGGVFTPAAAFKDSDFQERLEQAGIQFSWIKD